MINQRGEPIAEEWLYSLSELKEGELQRIVFLLLDHLKLEAYRTNATKHGNTEIVLREKYGGLPSTTTGVLPAQQPGEAPGPQAA